MNPLLAIVALALSLAGPPAWGALLDLPSLRSSGAPAFALIAAGCTLAIIAWRRDRRVLVRAVCAASFVVAAGFSTLFFMLMRLPPAPGFAALTIAPDFTLPDHRGNHTRLRDPSATGPTLVVFFRGHW
jgi:hypothetical protein